MENSIPEIPETTDLDLAYGKHSGLPEYNSIPEEFKNWNNRNKWVKFFDDMFFNGLKELKLTPKQGVDGDKAFRHIRSLMVSRSSKHEHKTAGCAYLFSQWFNDATWVANERDLK